MLLVTHARCCASAHVAMTVTTQITTGMVRLNFFTDVTWLSACGIYRKQNVVRGCSSPSSAQCQEVRSCRCGSDEPRAWVRLYTRLRQSGTSLLLRSSWARWEGWLWSFNTLFPVIE